MSRIVVLFGLAIAGCGGNKISTGDATAITAAEKWVKSQGMELKDVKLDAQPDGTDWSVYVERLPPAPGAHTFLKINPSGEVIEIVPGA